MKITQIGFSLLLLVSSLTISAKGSTDPEYFQGDREAFSVYLEETLQREIQKAKFTGGASMVVYRRSEDL